MGRHGFWIAGLSVIALTSTVSMLLAVLETVMTGEWSALWRGAFAVIVVLLPAALWLVVFFREDALEPEPHQYVLGILALGVIAGGGVLSPVLQVLDVPTWAQTATWQGWLGSMLHGMVIAGVVWLGVRLTIMPTVEFDERIDGMIYAIAMALGVAIADGLALVSASDMRGMAALSATITVDTLLMIAIGMVVGFALGGLKPGALPGYVVALALVGSGVLWWVHDVLRVVMVLEALQASSIRQLLPGLLVALAVLAAFAWLMRQGRLDASDSTDAQQYRRGDWWAIGVLIGVGVLAMSIHSQPGGGDRVVIHGPLRLVVPQQSFPERIGQEFPIRSVTGVRYVLTSEPTTATLAQAMAKQNLQRGGQCVSLTAGAEQYMQVGQYDAGIQEYVCLPQTGDRDAYYGHELLLIDGGTLYGVHLEGSARKVDVLEQSWQALLGSMQP